MRARWIESARPKQLPPNGDWRVWNVLAGRGFGKTRLGAEDAAYFALANPKVRVAVVSPTQNDCRSVCFEGESGILETIPSYFRRKRDYSAQTLELELPNGSMLIGKSAEKPDRLRGPQWHRAWCDEVAAWGAVSTGAGVGEGRRLQEAWSNLDFGLRLGDKPRAIITTTPRPIPFLRALLKNPRCITTRGSTFDNAANLAASALDTFRDVYEGTRRGQQELYGEILDNAENALWKYAQLDAIRAPEPEHFLRVVVAVDPAVTSEDDSDETGIIVAGLGLDGNIYVLVDASGSYSPRQWAREVLSLYSRYNADAIVSETNQGGDLVEANLRAESSDIFAFKGVHAKRGKYLRAEPVAAYYEKSKVRHCGRFAKLETQMCEFVGSTGNKSPDRLDALVYAVGELMLGTATHAFW